MSRATEGFSARTAMVLDLLAFIRSSVYRVSAVNRRWQERNTSAQPTPGMTLTSTAKLALVRAAGYTLKWFLPRRDDGLGGSTSAKASSHQSPGWAPMDARRPVRTNSDATKKTHRFSRALHLRLAAVEKSVTAVRD